MYDVYTNDSLHGMCFPTVLLHLSFSLLKKLECIDKSVIDRYSLIADLCGYAERVVFDLLRKALLLFGFSIYIFVCRCLNDRDSHAHSVTSRIVRFPHEENP